MTTYTTNVQLKVVYSHNPEQPYSEFEQGCREEFEIIEMTVGGKDVLDSISPDIDDVLYNYIKESNRVTL